MDTISKHSSKLVSLYSRKSNADAIVNSAKQLAKIILAETGILTEHRKLMLSRIQWIISEADGKYRTRYRSSAVVELATNSPESQVKINHDHVFTRKEITQRVLLEPLRCDEILNDVVGCILTKEEHTKLSEKHSGWERYRFAKIAILDMAQMPPQLLNFDEVIGG